MRSTDTSQPISSHQLRNRSRISRSLSLNAKRRKPPAIPGPIRADASTVCQKHSKTCPRQPPGTKIYEDENKNVAAFEIVGSEHPTYCQNLCLFAKLFIEHKTLYYDVAPFKFYVLTEKDKDGYHPVAYYSKENDSNENYNLACILTFPPHQRKGYGRFLMSLSYEMSKKAGILGSFSE